MLLAQQDRARWDRLLIHRGFAYLEQAFALDLPVGVFCLQAAIAACHARAASWDETDWAEIVALYDALLQAQPTPVVALNRAVAVGMAFEGAGPLLMLAPHEGVMGSFPFSTGLRRYALAVVMLWPSAVCGMLSFLLLSALRLKPSAAIVLALALYATDNLLRTTPETAIVRPYCVTTRLLSWRQVFNDEIPWARIRRNHRELLLLDAAFLVSAWVAFRRTSVR